MPKSDGQKRKLLLLERIFAEQTDEEHAISLEQITEMLEQKGISANRKTLYQDFEELRMMGIDIGMYKQSRTTVYQQQSRKFDLAELRMLVDAVQSAKFLSDSKSKDLIKKLESLASVYQKKELHHSVTMAGRVKTMNESVIRNVDWLQEAMTKNRQISFRYYQWNMEKALEEKHKDKVYRVSPWMLLVSQDNYYLVAYNPEVHEIRHFRVDKMKRIKMEEEEREGREEFDQVETPTYATAVFGMFSGKVRQVAVEGPAEKVHVLIDQFGKDIPIAKAGGNRFRATVSVVPNHLFLNWLTAVDMKVVWPEDVVEEMRQIVRGLNKDYGMTE